MVEGTYLGSATDLEGKFFIPNIPEKNYNLRVSMIGYQEMVINIDVLAKYTANLVIGLTEASLEMEAIVVAAEKPLVQKDVTSSQSTVRFRDEESSVVRGGRSSKTSLYVAPKPVYSEVYSKELSTVFELPIKNTIPSDNSPHKVTITIDDMPIVFEYTSIPKILPKVYLKGKIVNSKNYPLLEGDVNVFVDNDFVNRTFLNTIVPTDTLELALGTDESIQSEKVLINKFVESKGFIGGSRRITYEYEIRLANNRKTEESVWIYDQMPIARNEIIKVEMIEPKQKMEELDNTLTLKWHYLLKPGEKKIIPLKYYVEIPKDQNIYGLE